MDRTQELLDNLGGVLSGHSALVVQRANELSYLILLAMSLLRGGSHPLFTVVMAAIVLILTQIFNFYYATYSNNLLQDYRDGKVTDEKLSVSYKEKRKPAILLMNVIAAASLINLIVFITNVLGI